jgi:hypothetical protein
MLPTSLSIKVEVQTTDTAEVKGITALVDSRAMGLFIDSDLVAKEWLTTCSLTHPIPVYKADSLEGEEPDCVNNLDERIEEIQPSLENSPEDNAGEWEEDSPQYDWDDDEYDESHTQNYRANAICIHSLYGRAVWLPAAETLRACYVKRLRDMVRIGRDLMMWFRCDMRRMDIFEDRGIYVGDFVIENV